MRRLIAVGWDIDVLPQKALLGSSTQHIVGNVTDLGSHLRSPSEAQTVAEFDVVVANGIVGYGMAAAEEERLAHALAAVIPEGGILVAGTDRESGTPNRIGNSSWCCWVPRSKTHPADLEYACPCDRFTLFFDDPSERPAGDPSSMERLPQSLRRLAGRSFDVVTGRTHTYDLMVRNSRPVELTVVSVPVEIDRQQMMLDFKLLRGNEAFGLRVQAEKFCMLVVGELPAEEKGARPGGGCAASVEAEAWRVLLDMRTAATHAAPGSGLQQESR